MELKVLRTADRDEWSDLIARFDGNIFHSCEFAQSERCYGCEPLYFEFFDAQMPVGADLGFVSRRGFPLSFISKRLRFDTYPCVARNDPALIFEALRRIRDYAKRSGFLSLDVNSYDSPMLAESLEALGFAIKPRLEFTFDLTEAEEELWNRMPSVRRGHIRKAIKHDIKLYSLRTADGLEKLGALSKCSMERHAQKGLSPESVRSFGCLLEAGLASIYVAEYGGEIVSAILVAEFNRRGYSLVSGNSDTAKRIDAPSLLRWHTVQELKRKGFEKYTIGGVPASAENEGDEQHGLYMFKRGFGAEAHLCQSGSMECMRSAGERVARTLRMLRP